MLALSRSLGIFKRFLLQMSEQSVPERWVIQGHTAIGRLMEGGGEGLDSGLLIWGNVWGGLSGFLHTALQQSSIFLSLTANYYPRTANVSSASPPTLHSNIVRF